MTAFRDFAIVIGISPYSPPSRWSEGGGRAVEGAKAFAEWLRDPIGGNVALEDLHLLIDAGGPGGTSTHGVADIDREFYKVLLGAEELNNRGRRLYLYFAGYGTSTIDSHAGTLLIPNQDQGRLQGIDIQRYLRWGEQGFKEIVLIVDLLGRSSDNVPMHFPSYDQRISFGGPSPDHFHALQLDRTDGSLLFTDLLIRGLSGEARNADGSITGGSLQRYVYDQIIHSGDPGLLTPRFSLSRPESIVFRQPLGEPEVTQELESAASDTQAADSALTPRIDSDRWASSDALGYETYARTIAMLVTHKETRSPLTIGIKAPWGAGKTSLMKRIQHLLDGEAHITEQNESERRNRSFQGSLTLGEILDGLKTLTQEPSIAPKEFSLSTTPESTLEASGDKQREIRGKELRSTLQNLWKSITIPAGWVKIRNRITQGFYSAGKGIKRAATFESPKPKPSAAGISHGIAPRMTVWFNAWKYQTSEQIWAGLAHCIISQSTARMPPEHRELFWLKLHASRIDVNKLRWQVRLSVLRELMPLFVFSSLLIAGSTAAIFSTISIFSKTILGFSNTLIVAFSSFQYMRKLGEKVSGGFRDIVREPGYEGKVGFLHLVESDIREVLDLVATPAHPLVIFVDDLDRCAPNKVSEVVEAISLFLAGDYPNCIFILGMEPSIVAAALEVANKDLVEKLQSSDYLARKAPIGWRFMEKIVQLPLSVPAPGATGFDVYLDHLAGIFAIQGTEETHTQKLPRFNEYVTKLSAAKDLDMVVANSHQLMNQASAAEKPAIAEASKRAYAEKFTGGDPQVRRFLKEAAALLQENPRQLKRYVNAFRFASTLRHNLRIDAMAAGVDSPRLPSDEALAKYIALTIRWPQATECLRNSEPKDIRSNFLAQMEAQARQKEADSDKADAAWLAWLSQHNVVQGSWMEAREFRLFLRSGVQIGGFDNCGVW